MEHERSAHVNEREAPNDDDLDPESIDLPDRPEGSFEETTASGQLDGESIDQRARR
jgi:hypothetical protein